MVHIYITIQRLLILEGLESNPPINPLFLALSRKLLEPKDYYFTKLDKADYITIWKAPRNYEGYINLADHNARTFCDKFQDKKFNELSPCLVLVSMCETFYNTLFNDKIILDIDKRIEVVKSDTSASTTIEQDNEDAVTDKVCNKFSDGKKVKLKFNNKDKKTGIFVR